MTTLLTSGLRRAAAPVLAAAVLAAFSAGAHASRWSVGVNIGLPVYGGAVYGSPGYYSSPTYVSALPAGAVSVQVGGGRYWRHGGVWYRPYYGWYGPSWVVVPAPVVVAAAPPAEPVAAPLPATPARPDPVIYPRNGQSPEQTEYDRQECNRWATTQPSALADASVFQRAVEACMDGRGYSIK